MFDVVAVPAFKDNYLWLIHNGAQAAVVDPGDANPILAALEERKLALTAILLTHHHNDHIGGVPELVARFHVPVFGPAHDNIKTVTKTLHEGIKFPIPGLRIDAQVIEVPGHTAGHIAYFVPAHQWLFCGDTLFAGGCGRLFEGTPAQMLSSLEKLAALPPQTKVFCAHEYTLANLRFAQAAEPDNAAINQRMEIERAKRDQGLPTVPSTIALECATNPFLRIRSARIRSTLARQGISTDESAIAAFAALREWKNRFQ